VGSNYFTPSSLTGLAYDKDNMGPLSTLTAGANNTIRTTGKLYPNAETEYNEGMRMRQKAINRDYNQTLLVPATRNYGYTGQEKLMPIQSLQQVWATQSILNTTAGLRAWNIYAKLRLKDLADFFHKVPLLKGATMRFIMNTNQAITSFSIAQGQNSSVPTNLGNTTTGNPIQSVNQTLPTSNPFMYVYANNVVGGMTNPLMIASASIGEGNSALLNGTYQLSVSIVKCNFVEQGAYSGLANTALQSCRLYAPLYKFDPLAEKRYLSQKTKRICYKDVISYQFNTIPSSTNFNILVSQGVKNIKSVLVVPLIATNQNGYNAITGQSASASIVPTLSASFPFQLPSTLMSPFTTTGATPDPVILNNFNVAIGGVNVFLQDEMYDFEAFKHQLIASNQLNGNLTTGLTSGLINEKMFSYLYRYYYANCERELPTEAGKERSIQVKGRNLCLNSIDLLVFVEFERYLEIDLETGQRVG
jgi:hypothetical protein